MRRYRRFPAPSLPQDFPVRLERLEDRSGVSLEEMALSFGLPARSGHLWRVGRPPSEDELRAIVEFAGSVPGGVAVSASGRRTDLAGAGVICR